MLGTGEDEEFQVAVWEPFYHSLVATQRLARPGHRFP